MLGYAWGQAMQTLHLLEKHLFICQYQVMMPHVQSAHLAPLVPDSLDEIRVCSDLTIPPENARLARRTFAGNLKMRRLALGLEARSVAAALSIEQHRYLRYERAEVEPSLALIQRLCEVLQATPNDLLGHQLRSGEQRFAGHD